MSKVTRVVIPAAGLGTRFLPATKAQPKEMLPVVDKPAIQYVIEEAIRNDLNNILVVTGRGKRSIEDHFDQSFELEQLLIESGRDADLELVRAISKLGTIHYIRQGRPLGLGHAVLAAKAHVGSEPFVTMLADDIMAENSDLLSNMLALHDTTGCSVLSLMEVPREQIRLYGCAEVVQKGDGTVQVVSVVEKPEPSEAPSTLAITGRYLFTPEIFGAIEATPSGKNGEFQLTDAIARLSQTQPVLGVIFDRGRYDIGDKLEYLRAVVEIALGREDIGPAFAAELRGILAREFQTS
ncbi:UTP--glucose-1-phosphate uridylyltransferase GalU [Ferrimicrobium sp.]|uniref:UTP--glucose-1-phosphate uridylyltransferase GalU n=1 Tax=Ferrimicrobium sp. TaxID=2926050 RepID=UPI00260F45D9|nr:UTP--glucose-1-phosphate uridylyltransferase GalU [Ferrimicrobium sp.]